MGFNPSIINMGGVGALNTQMGQMGLGIPGLISSAAQFHQPAEKN